MSDPIDYKSAFSNMLGGGHVAQAALEQAIAHAERNTPEYQRARKQMDKVTDVIGTAFEAIFVALPPLGDKSTNDRESVA